MSNKPFKELWMLGYEDCIHVHDASDTSHSWRLRDARAVLLWEIHLQASGWSGLIFFTNL